MLFWPLKCFIRGFTRLKGQITNIHLTLHRIQTNGKLSVSLYLIFHHDMYKNIKIVPKAYKIKTAVTIFWVRIGTSLW